MSNVVHSGLVNGISLPVTLSGTCVACSGVRCGDDGVMSTGSIVTHQDNTKWTDFDRRKPRTPVWLDCPDTSVGGNQRRALGHSELYGHQHSKRVEGHGGDLQAGRWRKAFGQGQLEEAVEALDLQVQQGSYLDDSVFYSVLRECIAQRNLVLGSRIHALAVKNGYGSNSFLANHFIRMYASHGRLDEARRVFRRVPKPNQYMWCSIILAYARHGQPTEAIRLYMQMRELSVRPNNHVLVAALNACAGAEDLYSGKVVHVDILELTDEPNVFISNCLVDMYAKCGSLEDARSVFDNVPTRDVVTWNAMIAGYSLHGLGQEALTLYECMQHEGNTPPNCVTFASLLQACGSAGALHEGKKIHSQILDQKLESDSVVGACLVDMYAKCGSLEDAQSVFDNLPMKNVVTWTTMIAGYAQHGFGKEALALYASMEDEGITPANHVTFVCLLQACASIGALHQGKQLHAQIQGRGLETDIVIGTCLVDMHAKCGSLEDARRVFDSLPEKNVVTWTTMMAGYVQHELGHEALALYEDMQQEGITPANHVTYLCLLQACGSAGALPEGKIIHSLIQDRGLEADVVIGNCLINMYVKCGSLEDARRVFDCLPTKDVVSWNTMISGYYQKDLGQEALSLYGGMLQEGVTSPDAVTFVCLLKACSSVAGLAKGKEIHAQISNIGLAATDPFVASTLIDMYGDCGSMGDAQQVFEELPTRDIVACNALIAGYARHGESDTVFNLFQRVRQEGLMPNCITFLSLLKVCCNVGLVDKGQYWFEVMTRDYGIFPTMEHYNCMVDLLGRAGLVGKAMDMLRTMPFQPDGEAWKSVLGACQKWSIVELGREAFECTVMVDKYDAAAYVLMSNIYAAAQMQENAREIQEMRRNARAWKKPGHSSWTDISGIVHTFAAGNNEHSGNQHVHENLIDLCLRMKDLEILLGHWAVSVSNNQHPDRSMWDDGGLLDTAFTPLCSDG